MFQTLIENNLDIFILCFIGQASFMIFSFDLILKYFQTKSANFFDPIKVISISSVAFYLFYQFFKLIFIAGGVNLRIFPILCSSFFSFFVFKVIFHNKYGFYYRDKDIFMFFIFFLITNMMSIVLILYILNWFQII